MFSDLCAYKLCNMMMMKNVGNLDGRIALQIQNRHFRNLPRIYILFL